MTESEKARRKLQSEIDRIARLPRQSRRAAMERLPWEPPGTAGLRRKLTRIRESAR